MAKAPNKTKASSMSGNTSAPGNVQSARSLLLAALFMSTASLGGGFFLARMAFETDARAFEPDYVTTEGGDREAVDQDSLEDAGHEGEEKAAESEGFLEFEDIVTNVHVENSSPNGARAYLKLSVILVYRPEAGARQLMEARQPFMRDLFTTFARSLTEAEIRGAAGLVIVKSELLKRARAAAGNNLPQDVLIRDIVIQ